MKPSTILGPIFWIAATYLALTYGPIVLARAKGEIPKEEFGQKIVDSSPEFIKNVLGEQTDESSDTNESSNKQPALNPPQTPDQIPDFIQEIIQRSTTQIIEKSTEKVTETRAGVTDNVCSQIISEVQKQCDVIGGK